MSRVTMVSRGLVEPCSAQGSLLLSPLAPEPRLSSFGSTSRQDLVPSGLTGCRRTGRSPSAGVHWGQDMTLTGLCEAFWTQFLTLLYPDLVFQSLHFKGHFSFADASRMLLEP